MSTEQTYKFEVNPMTCQGCYNAVDRALKKVQGISKYDIDLPTKTVEIKTELPADKIVKALQEAGKEAVLIN